MVDFKYTGSDSKGFNMKLTIFTYSSSDSAVEKACRFTFNVSYEESVLTGLELNLYAVINKRYEKHEINIELFRSLQIALIQYVYFSRHSLSIKSYYLRYQFFLLPSHMKCSVREVITQAENANAFSLMGSSNPTHL